MKMCTFVQKGTSYIFKKVEYQIKTFDLLNSLKEKNYAGRTCWELNLVLENKVM